MTRPTKNRQVPFDLDFPPNEQLPRKFSISFSELETEAGISVRVVLDAKTQLGDIISDNNREPDFYRYHDVFHYTFATLLGWSPCTRALMKCKRKSNPLVDEFEDGARATITEEAVSLLVFNEAKQKEYFQSTRISRSLLRIIREMTQNFEVRDRTAKDWENAIYSAYEIFLRLSESKGGIVEFDADEKSVFFKAAA